MTPLSLSVVIPTVGRPSLAAALASVRGQGLREGDEAVLVCEDGHADARRVWAEAGLPGLFLARPGPSRDWGMAARNDGMAAARGSHLLFLDDDDALAPGAFAAARLAAHEYPDRVHLFRQDSEAGPIWRRPVLEVGNVSTGSVLVPNDPARLGRWPSCYEGDFYFIAATAALRPGGCLCWHEATVCLWKGGVKP